MHLMSISYMYTRHKHGLTCLLNNNNLQCGEKKMKYQYEKYSLLD